MDTKTTINLLLSNGDSGQTVAPNTGGYSYSFNTASFSASSFFAPLALCLIMVAIGGILLIKRNKHKFSLKNGMIGRVMVAGSVMGLCLLGIFATINKKASVQAIDNKITLTSLSSINTQQKPGEFSYTCDTLTTIDGTPAGYNIYAYVDELNSLKMIDNKDEYFAWTSQNILSDDTMGYSMESDNLSADSKIWSDLSKTPKVIKSYSSATEGGQATEVCYGIKSSSEKAVGEYAADVNYYAVAEPVEYRLQYDANGGQSSIDTQSSGETIAASYAFTITDKVPTRENYTFLGWAKKADSSEVDFKAGDKFVVSDLNNTLYAVWSNGDGVPIVEYSFPNSETEKGKYIFVNNAEVLIGANGSVTDSPYLADSPHLEELYGPVVKDGNIYGGIDKDTYTEIFYDHILAWYLIRNGNYHYAIRLYNPSETEVASVTFGDCGNIMTDSNSSQRYVDVYLQYYGGYDSQTCDLKNKTVSISPKRFALIMPKTSGNGAFELKKIDEVETSAGYDEMIAEVNGSDTILSNGFSGVVSLTSDHDLLASTFVFEDYSKTHYSVYKGNWMGSVTDTNDCSDGICKKYIQSTKYTGYFDKKPVARQESTYYITDETEAGALETRYKGSDGEIYISDDGYWATNNKVVSSDYCKLIDSDWAKLTMWRPTWNSATDSYNERSSNNIESVQMGSYCDEGEGDGVREQHGQGTGANKDLFNWGNWGVHYEDVITVVNSSSTEKEVSFNMSIMNNVNVAYSYENNGSVVTGVLTEPSGEGYYNNKITSIRVGAGETKTMTIKSTLSGNSNSSIKRGVVLEN